MTLPVAYLSEAQDDIDAAHTAYEGRSAGLGDRFLDAIREVIGRIEANPALYGVIYKDVRAAPLHRFPHVVYYRVLSDKILVLAVQHGGRRSRFWRGRI